MFPVEGYDDSNPERAQESLERVRRFSHPHMFEEAPVYELAKDGATNVIICPTRAVEKAHNTFFLGLFGAFPSFDYRVCVVVAGNTAIFFCCCTVLLSKKSIMHTPDGNNNAVADGVCVCRALWRRPLTRQFEGDDVRCTRRSYSQKGKRPTCRLRTRSYHRRLSESLDESGKPYHELRLAPGAPVQLLQTINVAEGLTKGLNAIVQRCREHSVVIRTARGSEHTIPRTTFKYCPKRFKRCVEINRHQLPLALNWASTVHRVQGDTLSRVVFDLRTPVSAHGHLYSEVTRVRKNKSLLFLVPKSTVSEDGTFVVVNVVLQKILGAHFEYE